MSDSRFYVYVIFRPNGAPCYVGKGVGRRCYTPRRDHNKHLRNLIRKYGELPIAKVSENLTEAAAYELEVALIASIGRNRHGGPLLNLTDGGEGASGHKHTEAGKRLIGEISRRTAPLTKTKRSAALKGRIDSPETRERKRVAALNRTPEHIAAAVAGRRAKSGYAHSKETCELIRQAVLNQSDETRDRRSVAARNRPPPSAQTIAKCVALIHTPEARAKAAAKNRGKKRSPESCALMSKIAQNRSARPKGLAAGLLMASI
jgi:hypothetical protein